MENKKSPLTYSDTMARRAARRHEKRTVDERLRLLGALAASAASDNEAIYTGIDPDTGREFTGTSVAFHFVSMAVYHFIFAYKRRAGCELESAIQKAKSAFAYGADMARRHNKL